MDRSGRPFPGTEMKTAEVILLAGKTLLDPKRWTQGVMARDAQGKKCQPDSIRAVAWDVVGILFAVSRSSVNKAPEYVVHALSAIDLAGHRLYRKSTVTVNDELGHEAVLSCLRLAYKRSK